MFTVLLRSAADRLNLPNCADVAFYTRAVDNAVLYSGNPYPAVHSAQALLQFEWLNIVVN